MAIPVSAGIVSGTSTRVLEKRPAVSFAPAGGRAMRMIADADAKADRPAEASRLRLLDAAGLVFADKG